MGPVATRRSQRIRRLGWDHVMSCESHVMQVRMVRRERRLALKETRAVLFDWLLS